MRLFVAAELPDRLFEALSETSAALRDTVSGRFVSPDRFHVTLAFLGEVPATDVDRIARAVERAAVARPPFETSLGALGTFGRGRNVVLWQGFSHGGDAWAELARGVRDELEKEGYPIEGRRYVPHVTYSYHAQIPRGELPMPCVATDVIHVVTLFRSDLSGDAPRYDPLARVELR